VGSFTSVVGWSDQWMKMQAELIVTTLLLIVSVVLACLSGCGGGIDAVGDQAVAVRATGDTISTAQGTWLGDFDGDGRPGIGDGIAILRIVVGVESYNSLADCNQDGRAGVDDAIMVLRCVVGLDEWPIGELSAEPNPVRNLVVSQTETDIRLTWDAPTGTSLEIDRYEIWRSIDAGLPLILPAVVGPDAVGYIDKDMLDGKRVYSYKVRVLYTDGSKSGFEVTPYVWFG
jgi:hypothetical protein